MASHDLPEPLRKIMQFASRLVAESQSASPKAMDYIGRMTSADGQMVVSPYGVGRYYHRPVRSNHLSNYFPRAARGVWA
ncbi:hypothetical protein [Dyadobacter sp. 50-39]|uniref:hypothetical protein n=1 Tax=Dyadobacter sp. 50-39 TaxID=1895756 RepID=UPI0025C4703A|nr:hypothetical protein [Dyadobacter sp. 50-39]